MATSQQIEKKIDAVLEREQTTRTEGARAAIRLRLLEEDRLAVEAEAQARITAARAAFTERAEIAHEQACVEYKVAVDRFRAARIKLAALDAVLNRTGFSTHHLGTELRHAVAAPDEGDVHHAYERAVASVRKTLGG